MSSILPVKIQVCDDRIKAETSEIVFAELQIKRAKRIVREILTSKIAKPDDKIQQERANANITHFEQQIKLHQLELEDILQLKEDYEKQMKTPVN